MSAAIVIVGERPGFLEAIVIVGGCGLPFSAVFGLGRSGGGGHGRVGRVSRSVVSFRRNGKIRTPSAPAHSSHI